MHSSDHGFRQFRQFSPRFSLLSLFLSLSLSLSLSILSLSKVGADALIVAVITHVQLRVRIGASIVQRGLCTRRAYIGDAVIRVRSSPRNRNDVDDDDARL